MAFLLVDNSNTRTKFALADAEGLLEFRAIIQTADISLESVSEAVGAEEFDSVLISSVVPEKAKVLESCFAGKKVHLLGLG